MLNIQSKPELTGGFETIDFPKHLSPAGQKYFANSLQGFKEGIALKLEEKIKPLSPADILEIIKQEARAIATGQDYYDFDMGIVPVLQGSVQLACIDMAQAYIAEKQRIHDCALYVFMKKRQRESVIIAREEVPFAALCDNSKDFSSIVASNAYRSIFLFYRLSQFDILEPHEKNTMMANIKSDSDICVFMEEDRKNPDLHYAPVSQVMDVYADQIVVLYNRNHKNHDKANGAGFIAFQRIAQLFENIQAMLFELVYEDVDYTDFCSISEVYQSFISEKSISEYNKKIFENARMLQPLKPEDTLHHQNFTNTFYKIKMDDKDRDSFDAHVQFVLDKAATRNSVDTIQVSKMRKHVNFYSKPYF